MNSSNISLIRSKRHMNYVGEPNQVEKCYRPYNYEEEIEDACLFVKNNKSCSAVVVFFDYLKSLVCILHLENNTYGIAMALFNILLAGIIFLTLTFVLTRYFLYPNAVVLVKCMKMKQYHLGAVIVSIIRSLPEALTDGGVCYGSSRTYALQHADNLGRIIIDFLLSLSVICVCRHTRISGGIFLREILFTTAGVAFLHINLLREMYNMFLPPLERTQPMIKYSSYLFIAMYTLYVLLVMVFARLQNVQIDQSTLSIPTSSESFDSDEYPEMDSNPIEDEVDPCEVFYTTLNPMVNIESKYLAVKILLTPFYIPLALIIPVVKHDRPLHGWCKFLFPFSILPVIIFLKLLTVSLHTTIAIYIIITVIVFFIFFLTHTQRIPLYHDFTSIWNILLSFIVISMIENELNVFLWQILHYLFNWTDDAIYLVMFSCNSVGLECIFIYELVKNGYEQMAMGIIMGSIIFVAYSSLPVMSLAICFQMDQYFLVTAGTYTAFIFTYLALAMVVLSLALTGFELRWSHGAFFIGIILTFVIYILLCNSMIIHPMGTTHAVQLFPDVEHVTWA